MIFGKKQPVLTRQQQLASRPIQLVAGEMLDAEGGGGRLKVKIQPRRAASWLMRMPEGAAKTFEFDSLGKFVWDHCDGHASVQQIARKLAKTYNVSQRKAQMATEKFLATLAKKGLIGAAVPRKNQDERSHAQ